MRNCKFFAVILAAIVTASGTAGYVVYARTPIPKFELYIAVFHILFEDASHNLLGKLTGKLEIAKTNPSTVVSTLTVAFSSQRSTTWHKSYIDHVTLEVEFGVNFFDSVPRTTPPSPIQTQTLNDGQKVVSYKASHDISKFKQPMICICCVLRSYLTSEREGTIPSIQAYFSDGQVWRYNQNIYPLWQNKYEYPPSAIIVKLSELSGKTETTTIDLTTVEVVKAVFGSSIFTVVVFLLPILLITAIYLLYSARKSKNARPYKLGE